MRNDEIEVEALRNAMAAATYKAVRDALKDLPPEIVQKAASDGRLDAFQSWIAQIAERLTTIEERLGIVR